MITIAAVKKLISDAEEPLIRERAKAELAALKEELVTKREERRTLKATLSEDYTDFSLVNFNNGLTKSIKDLLIPGYKAILESTKESISAHSINIETYRTMQLDIMRRIDELKIEIEGLIQKSADFYGNPQRDINDDITSKYYDLEELKELLSKVSIEIAKEVLAKAEAEAKKMVLNATAVRFNNEIPTPTKPISSKRTVIAAEVLTLCSEIEKLEKREKVLTTNPGVLGREILSFIEEGREVPPDKIETLQFLATGSSTGTLDEEPMGDNIKAPVRETLASLKASQSSNATRLLASSKSSEYTKSEIIRMAAAVAYYIRVLNEAKLLREKVEKLKGNETNLTKIAEFRRNIIDIDKIIEEIEKEIEKYSDFLDNQIFYFNGLLSDQTSFYYTLGDLAIRISQVELNNSAPFRDDSVAGALKNISAKIPLLNSCYPAPFIEGFEEDAPDDTASILSDLKGENYPTETKPTEPEAVFIEDLPQPTADLSKLDPNSETPSSVLREVVTKALEVEPVKETVLALDPSQVMEDLIIDPPKMPEPLPVAPEIKEVPIAKIMETAPMSVREYESREEKPTYPAPRVEKVAKVNVPKINRLIKQALEAIKKFLSEAEGIKRI